jgi:hypothetical protein
VISRTELVFLGIGIVGHAAFIAGASRVKAPAYRYQDVSVAYVDIEIPKTPEEHRVDDPEHPEDREVATNDHIAGHDGRRGSDPRSLPRIGSGNPDQTGAPNSDSTDSPSLTAEPRPDEYDDPESQSFTMPGAIGGPKVWELAHEGEIGGNGPPAPTEAPKQKKVSREAANDVLGAAIKEKDKKLGLQLPAAGTVSSAARDIVWSSDLPETTAGTIVVQLGPDGSVISVTVASAGPGSSAQWQAVAANLKASLAGRGLKLTDEYKKGAIITVSVLSKMQNPSGTDPDNPVKLGTTTTFDISDLGAKPIRQVRVSSNVTPVK